MVITWVVMDLHMVGIFLFLVFVAFHSTWMDAICMSQISFTSRDSHWSGPNADIVHAWYFLSFARALCRQGNPPEVLGPNVGSD